MHSWLVVLLTAATAAAATAVALRRRHRKQAYRYAAQRLILGHDGQNSLQQGAILIIGCGGLASGCIPLLAGSGISRIGLVDFDRVELGNLHRQTIHSEKTLGWLKVDSAEQYIAALNSNVKIEKFPVRVEDASVLAGMITANKFDLILDCTDNLRARYLINQACVWAERPLVFAAALGTFGQLAVFWPSRFPDGGCLECAFPQANASGIANTSCSTNGVLGPVPTILGAMQALEAIKLLANLRARVLGDSPHFSTSHQALVSLELDCLNRDTISVLKLKRRGSCNACGQAKRENNNSSDEAVLEGREVIEIGETDIVVDVRPNAGGHPVFPRADLVLSLDELRRGKLELPLVLTSGAEGRRIVCVCRTGISSRVAARILLFHHPKLDVGSLQGGLDFFSF